MIVAKLIFIVSISTFAATAAELPIPDLPKILQIIKSKQQTNQFISNNYVCTAKSTVHLVNSDGHELSKGNEFESIAVPHNGAMLWKTIKINGKDIDEKTRLEEEALIRSQIESSEKPADKFWGFPSITKILETCKIHIEGRKMHSDRSVIVIKFDTPNTIPQDDHMAKYAAALSGQILVDEDNGQLVKFQAKVTKNVELFGNKKLKMTSGTTYSRECQFIENKIWLPINSTLRSPTGNILNRNFIENITYFVDYHRFEVGEINIGPASK